MAKGTSLLLSHLSVPSLCPLSLASSDSPWLSLLSLSPSFSPSLFHFFPVLLSLSPSPVSLAVSVTPPTPPPYAFPPFLHTCLMCKVAAEMT